MPTKTKSKPTTLSYSLIAEDYKRPSDIWGKIITPTRGIWSGRRCVIEGGWQFGEAWVRPVSAPKDVACASLSWYEAAFLVVEERTGVSFDAWAASSEGLQYPDFVNRVRAVIAAFAPRP